MSDNMTENKIKKAIDKIRHSAIDCTLVDLGIIKDFELNKGNSVIITLAFPFENIPIKDYLIMSVKVPLEKMGLKVDVKTTVMNEEEAQKFLDMECKYWKDGQ